VLFAEEHKIEVNVSFFRGDFWSGFRCGWVKNCKVTKKGTRFKKIACFLVARILSSRIKQNFISFSVTIFLGQSVAYLDFGWIKIKARRSEL
jgi:hypothetical protein